MGLDDDDSSGESSSESTRGLSPRSKKQAKALKKHQAASGQTDQLQTRKKMPDAAEANNIYQKDPNQLDLVKAISSMELLNIAEKFD